ncbi:type II secretion system F family protein [Salinivibrio kushneri]|uniref:type II secretion system F family protein n=1 Tax=Salinivibrio kushneri TaxID=1908198 RepID=UPI00098908A0|nr:type II secretion system F family protein [Salinivibrio kushneri]OOE70447.1 type II secretion system protein F [Salinivibrio kushneri]
MKDYKYIARRSDGSQSDGWIRASSDKHAKAILEERNLHVVLVVPEKTQRKNGPKIKRESIMTCLRELATLRESGMALDVCVYSLIETTDEKPLKNALVKIHQDISSGLSLSNAIESQPKVFPFYVGSMLKLGESNGDLSSSIKSVAERMEKEEAIATEIRSALTYPSFLVIICVLVVLFLFSYVIPNFESMISEANKESALAGLVSTAQFINDNIAVIVGLLIALVVYVKYLSDSGKLHDIGLAVLKKLPYVKELVQAWQVVQFSSSMQKLSESGVDLVEALTITNNNVSDVTLNKKLNLVIGRVKEGQSLGSSLSEYSVFPAIVTRLIASGEQGAALVSCFREITKLYERRLSVGIKRALSVLEPAIIVIMGGIVGSIMIVLISGIISINEIGW